MTVRIDMLKIQTEKILQQKMDRKMFLKTTGVALVGLVGVTAVARKLDMFGSSLVATQPAAQQQQRSNGGRVSLAYGRSPYGA